MRVLFILLFIPILGLGQNSQMNVSRKLQIVELQKTADSINRSLKIKTALLLENKATHQIELEKQYQKQEKIQLASQYLKKAKRGIKTGIIVSGVTLSTLFVPLISAISELTNSTGQGNYAPDASGIYLLAAAPIVLIGQMINVPLQISATNNIYYAREIIREIKTTTL